MHIKITDFGTAKILDDADSQSYLDGIKAAVVLSCVYSETSELICRNSRVCITRIAYRQSSLQEVGTVGSLFPDQDGTRGWLNSWNGQISEASMFFACFYYYLLFYLFIFYFCYFSYFYLFLYQRGTTSSFCSIVTKLTFCFIVQYSILKCPLIVQNQPYTYSVVVPN